MLAACARSLGEALATLGREPFDGGI
jgi:hypothetical protein